MRSILPHLTIIATAAAASKDGSGGARTIEEDTANTINHRFDLVQAAPRLLKNEPSASCPPQYDPFKTDYEAGEQIGVEKGKYIVIFQCRDEEHENYCNVPTLENTHISKDDEAYKIWMNAWEQLGTCDNTNNNPHGAPEDKNSKHKSVATKGGGGMKKEKGKREKDHRERSSGNNSNGDEGPGIESPTESPVSNTPTLSPIVNTTKRESAGADKTLAPQSPPTTASPVSASPTISPVSTITSSPTRNTSSSPTMASDSKTPRASESTSAPTENTIVTTIAPTKDTLSTTASKPTEDPLTTLTKSPISMEPTNVPTDEPSSKGSTPNQITNEPSESHVTGRFTLMPSNSPATGRFTLVPTKAPKATATSNKPSRSPVLSTMSPSQSPVTEVPTKQPTAADNGKTSSNWNVPVCPDPYDKTKTYAFSKNMEISSYVWTCRNQHYCNIVNIVDEWSDAEKKEWREAWLMIGPCEKVVVVDSGDANGTGDTRDANGASSSSTTDSPITPPPRTSDPTRLPTMPPVTNIPTTPKPSPTSLVPTKQPTTNNKETPTNWNVPVCPDHYDKTKTYTFGEKMEVSSHVWTCRNQHYCNIADIVASWTGSEKQEWRDAWLMIGPCEKVVVVDSGDANGTGDTRDANGDSSSSTTDSPITPPPRTSDPTRLPTMPPITSEPTTLAPVATPILEKKTPTNWNVPICPPAYDITKTYDVGENMEVSSHIWTCSMKKYCNIVDMLDEWTEEEKQGWRDAWMLIAPCEKATVDSGGGQNRDAGGPVTNSPTTPKPTLPPVTSEPTTLAPVAIPILEKRTPTNWNVPICPDQYDETKTYQVGETATIASHIWTCRNKKYCNTANIVDEWSGAEKQEWRDAWQLIAPCDDPQVFGDMIVGEVREDASSVTTAEVTSSSSSPENYSYSYASSEHEEIEETILPLCPSAYDPSFESYRAGDQITIKCDVFQCKDEEHEFYCNVPAWNDSLLERDENAKKLWMAAWELLGKCRPTQSVLMEEEAFKENVVDWECLG